MKNFPKAMSIKKAEAWADANKLSYREQAEFWDDQRAKHLKNSRKGMIVAMVGLSIAALAQVFGIIVKVAGL